MPKGKWKGWCEEGGIEIEDGVEMEGGVERVE